MKDGVKNKKRIVVGKMFLRMDRKNIGKFKIGCLVNVKIIEIKEERSLDKIKKRGISFRLR